MTVPNTAPSSRKSSVAQDDAGETPASVAVAAGATTAAAAAAVAANAARPARNSIVDSAELGRLPISERRRSSVLQQQSGETAAAKQSESQQDLVTPSAGLSKSVEAAEGGGTAALKVPNTAAALSRKSVLSADFQDALSNLDEEDPDAALRRTNKLFGHELTDRQVDWLHLSAVLSCLTAYIGLIIASTVGGHSLCDPEALEAGTCENNPLIKDNTPVVTGLLFMILTIIFGLANSNFRKYPGGQRRSKETGGGKGRGRG